MSTTMYETAVPVLLRGLQNLKHCLKKAEAHADEHEIDPSVLLASRLYPDMFPLVRQVQIVTDFARRTCARLAGHEVPSSTDDETSFAQLHERIDGALAELKALEPAAMEGSESREIRLQVPTGTYDFSGRDYLLHFSFPNFFFHLTTAYGILRHNGVPLGKLDFLGAS